jgi:thiamine pyrophosphate-dependent acetolactate synthase large subunit-like protein
MKLLWAYGVDTVFGMAGTHTVDLYRGIARAEIRHVQCRNEQGAILEAAELLANAASPLIVAGGGATGTRESLTAVAELIGAPVLSTNAGKGILPESHPLSLGCSVLQKPSQQALADADVVLVVGSQIAEDDHFRSQLDIHGELIRIDIDPGELASKYAAVVPIQSNAIAAMDALWSALRGRAIRATRDSGEARTRETLARNAAAMTRIERQHARVWNLLRSALPADTIVMGDATQLVYSGCFAMPMEMERCWYYSGSYCSLGVALPMAIGAKIGAPHRPVIAVAGDGGIMFTINELATAAQERIALPVIVWNNDALKEIVDQMDQRRVPRIGVEPKTPDFIRVAEGFGCHAVRAASAEHLIGSLRDALGADRPTLIEVREDSSWLLD